MKKLFLHGRPLGSLKLLGLGLILTALPATADEGAAEYREHVMSAVGGHMQSMADIVRGKVDHQDHFGLHANAMADLAGITNTLFPAGSEGGDALPAIWQNTDDFAGKVSDFESAASALKAAVDDGGNLGQAIQNLGQACKSCHDDYRAD
jgi:cytochrome c556